MTRQGEVGGEEEEGVRGGEGVRGVRGGGRGGRGGRGRGTRYPPPPLTSPDGKYKVGDFVYFETRQPGVIHFGIISATGKMNATLLLYKTEFCEANETSRPLWNCFIKRIHKRYEWLHAGTRQKQELILCSYDCVIHHVVHV